jgi:hypothetical protein
MLEPGNYKGRAVTWGLGETSTGKEQIAIEFMTMDTAGVEGPHINWFGYFSDAAFETTIKALRTCGWTGIDVSDLSGLDANEVQLIVEHEEYEGKKRARVRWINPVGGLTLKAPMSPEKTRKFAAEMKIRITALEGAGAVRQRQSMLPPRASRQTEQPPEDLPF